MAFISCRWSKSFHSHNGVQSWWNCVYFPSRNVNRLVCSKRLLSIAICTGTYKYCCRCNYACCNTCFNHSTLQKVRIHKSIQGFKRKIVPIACALLLNLLHTKDRTVKILTIILALFLPIIPLFTSYGLHYFG